MDTEDICQKVTDRLHDYELVLKNITTVNYCDVHCPKCGETAEIHIAFILGYGDMRLHPCDQN
jgi:hypothetical protein